MKTHNKLKIKTSNDEVTNREKAELIFMLFFVCLLGATVLAFIVAGVQVLTGVAG